MFYRQFICQLSFLIVQLYNCILLKGQNTTFDHSCLLLDKSAGGKFLKEFNENCAKLQDYCDSLAAEVDARKDIIHLLTDAYTSCTASISQLVQTIKVLSVNI